MADGTMTMAEEVAGKICVADMSAFYLGDLRMDIFEQKACFGVFVLLNEQ